MSTDAQLRLYLAEAKQAYHDLRTGVSVKVMVHQNGQRVEYVQANAPMLKAYIAELETALGGAPTVSGPMKVFF